MSRKCVGGQLDGMAVFITEDVNACVNGGGNVVSDGSGGGCGLSSMAAMSPPTDSKSGRKTRVNQSLASFRKLRASASEHPLVQAALALNSLAAPEIERIGREDIAMQMEFAMALYTLGGVVEAITTGKETDKTYNETIHAQLVKLGHRVSEKTDDAALKQGIAFLLSLAEPLVGRTFGEIADEMIGSAIQDTLKTRPETVIVANSFPSAAIIRASNQVRFSSLYSDVIFVDRKFPSATETRLEEARAKKAIDAKAHALGGWLGGAVGDGEFVVGGYRQLFENADLYVGANGVAYEVHGDIRRKYNFLHGPDGPLGLPITDETGTPDGIGRFNHFEHGSIYWTPNTGPMMVGGVIRKLWASQGWENGPMGYPVADEYRLPGLYPSDKPNIAWSPFQNGTLFAQGNAVAQALAAEIQPDALKSLVRTFFDRRLHDAGQDLGLEAQVDLVEISGWNYGFLWAVPRAVTYRLHGFHSNPIISDTTFEITVRLRFGTAWSMSFTYPTAMSLIVALDWLSVHADGAGSGQLANGIYNGIEQAFNRGGPEPDHPEVPNGAIYIASFPTNVDQRGSGSLDVINTLVTAQGGLQVLVNPLPPSFGGIRRNVAQSRIDAFLESF